MSVRRIAFGDSSVSIEAFGERAERLVEFLCRHLPSAKRGVSELFEVRGDAEGAPLTLSSSSGLILTTGDDGELVERLMQEMTLRLVERSQAGAHIHGALVTEPGHAVLMPGTSGSGKSSLAAWLVTRGFALSTDEVVHLPFGASEVSGLARPIHLKRGIPSLTNVSSTADRSCRLPLREGELLQPEALGGNAERDVVRLSAIVFPTWSAGADDTIVELPPATATRELMGVLANARSLPGHGFSEMARLARAVPAFRLTHRSVEAGERLVRSVGLGVAR